MIKERMEKRGFVNPGYNKNSKRPNPPVAQSESTTIYDKCEYCKSAKEPDEDRLCLRCWNYLNDYTKELPY